MSKINFFLLFYIVIFCMVQCKKPSSKTTTQTAIEKNQHTSKSNFITDSAYNFIKKQVEFGPRVPNTVPHQLTGDYLIEKLTSWKWDITEQKFLASTFDNNQLELRNIIASYNPNKKKRILLGAHWDTRPFADKDSVNKNQPILGANDGASGVGILLEIARIISIDDALNIGVDIILFDGEDWGNDINYHGQKELEKNLESWWCLGSQYWSKNKHKNDYHAYYGILLDMVGGREAKFLMEGFSTRYAPKIVNKIWSTGQNLGYNEYFIKSKTGEVMDDHYFINKNANIPTVNIITSDPKNQSFGSFHHTHDDNMDIIDKNTLEAVGRTVLNIIYQENK